MGPVYGGRLLDAFGGPGAALDATPSDWQGAGVPKRLHPQLQPPDSGGIQSDLDWLAGEHRGLLTHSDPRYPRRLREAAVPPLALFYQGDAALLCRPQVAVVGSRSATPQGLESAAGFAAELGRHGLLVSSGLAQGIDGAAHRGALDAGNPTVAVCGTGLDRVYPARHRALAHRIASHGVLVSEFPTGTQPLPENFPRRNRILSGLALGVLVVEAAPQSGSLITARLALEQGREVFAIPGSIHSPLSRGTHALIRQGAKLTETVHDLLEELMPLLGQDYKRPGGEPGSSAAAAELAPEVRRVLDALGYEATPFDRLLERVSLPLDRLSATLLTLELEGLVTSVPGGAYLRVAG